jgi:hypothetical protein
MSEPVAVDPSHLLEFVGRPSLSVVFVSVHAAHAFNRSVCHYLDEGADEEVAYGEIPFLDLILSGGPALPVLHQGLQACGGPASYGVVPGYWLFRGGEVLAWDGGLPTVGDARAVARSALLGALWSSLTRNLAFIGQALRFASEEITAQRVAVSFRAAAAARRPASHRPPPRQAWTPADELSRAYQVLGVPRDATDEEVHAAWRRLRVENHPDRAAQDPAEFARLSRLSAILNRARDVIMSNRSPRHQRRAAAV